MFKNLDAEQSRNGMSNSDVAERLGISRQAYEQKKKNGNFSRPQILLLLKMFNVTFEYLFATEE